MSGAQNFEPGGGRGEGRAGAKLRPGFHCFVIREGWRSAYDCKETSQSHEIVHARNVHTTHVYTYTERQTHADERSRHVQHVGAGRRERQKGRQSGRIEVKS
jgi:hypothetical protein